MNQTAEETTIKNELGKLEENIRAMSQLIFEKDNIEKTLENKVPMSSQKLDQIRLRLIKANKELLDLLMGLRHLR